jgi:hypothetical protein
MLPTRLKAIKDALDTKGYDKRSTAEDELLAELNEVEKNLPQSIVENLRTKGASAPYSGPSPTGCPTCGRSWS